MDKPRCKICGGNVNWRGKIKGRILSITHARRRYQCTNCGAWDATPPRHNRPAKILLLDIETLPMEYYVWNPDTNYLQPEMQIKDWSISCWASKWLFEPEIMGKAVSPKEAIERKEGSILEEIWKLVNEADIVVTQNGTRFDMPKLSTKWLLYGYKPPSQYLNVDTLRVATQKFSFTYNRLDELGKKFGIGEKTKMNLPDFKACAEGNKEALAKMLVYCKRDVAPLLEDVYLYMLPWIENHPNMNIFTDHDGDVCRNCGSQDVLWNTRYATPQGLWNGWRCNLCGAIGRGTKKEHKEKSTGIK